MRITDDRYSRDRLRFDLALRFIRHEARTHTIRTWTGLTDDRIRKLYRSYLREADGQPVPRHRGKSPRQAGFFMRSARIQQETAILASLCCLHGVLAPRDASHLRPPGSITRGELLCQAFETYRACVPNAQISFEHAVFLIGALGRGDELALASCPGCGSLNVRDRLALRERHCPHCGGHAEPAARRSPAERRLPLGRIAALSAPNPDRVAATRAALR
ncbi:MAG: hypothetical protein IPI06_11300 [Gammaproteobacteria bacterium]|nr:hypothetical protein [Gammaproteobacteria bacterium]